MSFVSVLKYRWSITALLAMLDVLDHYTVTGLRRAAAVCFPALKQIGFV